MAGSVNFPYITRSLGFVKAANPSNKWLSNCLPAGQVRTREIRKSDLQEKRLLKKEKRYQLGQLIPAWLPRTWVVFCPGFSNQHLIKMKSQTLMFWVLLGDRQKQNWWAFTFSSDWPIMGMSLVQLFFLIRISWNITLSFDLTLTLFWSAHSTSFCGQLRQSYTK